MRKPRFIVAAFLALAALTGWACNGDSVTGASSGQIRVKLTDAPFPTDSVDSVNVFVTRVEMRVSTADSVAADSAVSADSASAHGWVTVATPNKRYDLMELRNGASVDLGVTPVSSGHYSGMRLVIDPAQSNVVLVNGMVLTATSSPNVTFPSGSTSGIKINLTNGIDVIASDTTTVMLDFNLDQSFVQRGNSITRLGLLFKPVIQASVVAN